MNYFTFKTTTDLLIFPEGKHSCFPREIFDIYIDKLKDINIFVQEDRRILDGEKFLSAKDIPLKAGIEAIKIFDSLIRSTKTKDDCYYGVLTDSNRRIKNLDKYFKTINKTIKNRLKSMSRIYSDDEEFFLYAKTYFEYNCVVIVKDNISEGIIKQYVPVSLYIQATPISLL